jgi:ABC-type transporter Mla MlaB component
MAMNIRVEGNVAILSNFARLMNDPRYVDAARDVHDMLDQGMRNYVLELAGVKETGSSFLGVLMTITREIRRAGGEAELAHLSRDVEKYLALFRVILPTTYPKRATGTIPPATRILFSPMARSSE